MEFHQLYGRFAEAWRVTAKTSLFDYAEGESVDTFVDRNMPPERQPRAADLDAAVRRKAEAICRGQGCRMPSISKTAPTTWA